MNHDIVINFNMSEYVDAVYDTFRGVRSRPEDESSRPAVAVCPFNSYPPVSEFGEILSPKHGFDIARDRFDRIIRAGKPALVLGVDDVRPSAERSIGNGQQLIDFTMKAFVLYPLRRNANDGDVLIARDIMKVAGFVYKMRRFGKQVTPAVLLPIQSRTGENVIENNEQVRCQSVTWLHTTALPYTAPYVKWDKTNGKWVVYDPANPDDSDSDDAFFGPGEFAIDYPHVVLGEPVEFVSSFVNQLLTTRQSFTYRTDPPSWVEDKYNRYHEMTQQP